MEICVDFDNPTVPPFEIPELATVIITRGYEVDKDSKTPGPTMSAVAIKLDPAYTGELTKYLDPATYGEYFAVVTEATAGSSDLLAMFMEVAHHWDYNKDGIFDADDVIEVIEEVLTKSTETPRPFHRPEGWFSGTLMKFMPPQPQRHVVYGFGKLARHNKWWYYLWAIPAVAAFIGLVLVQVHFVPFLMYSPLSAYLTLMGKLGVHTALSIAGLFVIFGAMRYFAKRKASKKRSMTDSWHPLSVGVFDSASTYEEQAFRQGAENWTFAQRAYSCFAFGAIHQVNLFYSLATILPLSIGGALLMGHYLRTYKRTPFQRTAVMAAAVKHRIYNRVALTGMFITLVFIAGQGVWQLFAFMAPLAGMFVADFINLKRHGRTTQSFKTTTPAAVQIQNN